MVALLLEEVVELGCCTVAFIRAPLKAEAIVRALMDPVFSYVFMVSYLRKCICIYVSLVQGFL